MARSGDHQAGATVRPTPKLRVGERPPIPGVGPTGVKHDCGGQLYRFIVREGPPSHGGVNARVDVGSYYRKCMGCGAVVADDAPAC